MHRRESSFLSQAKDSESGGLMSYPSGCVAGRNRLAIFPASWLRVASCCARLITPGNMSGQSRGASVGRQANIEQPYLAASISPRPPDRRC